MNNMILIFNAFIFLFGLCIGSFLNCVIYRLEEEKTLQGRSFCPHCKHTLSWADLFPVFSFLYLAGKCRYCHKKISIQYPLVELITGILFVLIFNFQFSIFNELSIFQFFNLIFLLYIASVLIAIFVYDLKHFLIPDKILFPAIFIAIFYRILEFSIFNFQFSNFALLGNYFLAVIIGSGFFLIIFLISAGRWIGFGDVKLAILMGLTLGFPNILVGLFLAFFLGAIIGVITIILPARAGSKKKSLKSEIPFGPFLISGTFIALFFAKEIINWYLHFFFIK